MRAPESAAAYARGLRARRGLAEQRAVEQDHRVAAEHEARPSAARARLAARVLDDHLARDRRPRSSSTPGADLEGDARAARGSPAAAASGGEDSGERSSELGEEERRSRARRTRRESEPCTRLVPISIAKSPRIEPGAASSGLVAPITWRAASTASSPSSTIATSGPRVMNSTSSPKNGLARRARRSGARRARVSTASA